MRFFRPQLENKSFLGRAMNPFHYITTLEPLQRHVIRQAFVPVDPTRREPLNGASSTRQTLKQARDKCMICIGRLWVPRSQGLARVTSVYLIFGCSYATPEGSAMSVASEYLH